jgi:hypothetical protein
MNVSKQRIRHSFLLQHTGNHSFETTPIVPRQDAIQQLAEIIFRMERDQKIMANDRHTSKTTFPFRLVLMESQQITMIVQRLDQPRFVLYLIPMVLKIPQHPIRVDAEINVGKIHKDRIMDDHCNIKQLVA